MASVVGSIARRALEARNVRHKTNSRDCWNTFTTTRGTEIEEDSSFDTLSVGNEKLCTAMPQAT